MNYKFSEDILFMVEGIFFATSITRFWGDDAAFMALNRFEDSLFCQNIADNLFRGSSCDNPFIVNDALLNASYPGIIFVDMYRPYDLATWAAAFFLVYR